MHSTSTTHVYATHPGQFTRETARQARSRVSVSGAELTLGATASRILRYAEDALADDASLRGDDLRAAVVHRLREEMAERGRQSGAARRLRAAAVDRELDATGLLDSGDQ